MKTMLDNIELNKVCLFDLDLYDHVWLPAHLNQRFFGFSITVYLCCFVTWMSPSKHKVELKIHDELLGVDRMITVEDNHFHPDKMRLCKVLAFNTDGLVGYIYNDYINDFLLIEYADSYNRVIDAHNELVYKVLDKLFARGLKSKEVFDETNGN